MRSLLKIKTVEIAGENKGDLTDFLPSELSRHFINTMSD